MEATSGLRPARRWRLLLAHDAASTTCDGLADAIVDALGNVDVVDAWSADDARLDAGAGRLDVCLVCLDLAPAPVAGVRLAQEMVEQGLPVVIVTRSQRWIPQDAADLRQLPWIVPEASSEDVCAAIQMAIASRGLVDPWAPDVGAAGLAAG
ncbi:MAG TPA: hypothetical protein VGM56_31260 [Byssovorax sp.]|jgi:hypothetical protein